MDEHDRIINWLTRRTADEMEGAAAEAITKLRAELAECKQDAERYRWLRDWAGRETITQLSHIEPDAWDAFVDGEMEGSK